MTTARFFRCLVLAGAACSFSALLAGCGTGDTGGKRIVLETRVVVAGDDAGTFLTGRGWTVTPSRILLGSGPLYYFDGAPPFARRVEPPLLERVVRRFFTIKEAHAHPGHYQPGDALGQMLQPYTEDLLGGAVDLPSGSGVTGTYRSGRFSFAEVPAGPGAGELGGHAAIVRGRAEKDGEEPREFVAVADFADIARSQTNAEVSGCVFEEADVGGDGTVTVTVRPHVWFDLVDFSEVDPGSEAEPATFEAGSRPRVAFAQGLAQLSAYSFAFAP
jgi:hypothetical protein